MIGKHPPLNAAEIQEKLKVLPHWQCHNNALERLYEGESYLDALARLNQVAQLSEQADHHPDLTLTWKKLLIRYWTHTAQGVTDLDFQLAHQVEAIFKS